MSDSFTRLVEIRIKQMKDAMERYDRKLIMWRELKKTIGEDATREIQRKVLCK